ncbi:lipocalin family protein [Aquimarina brevivitae]|uniref:Lipocalin-like domain-containing protein n=1 Tax=Aquimarina brevivitae TaxID=323412 RepID=A0A4Q7P3L2_9FLAO|nr:lipocalin family protein [Aquimarina brevivitae]RZS93262.1 hypothetical protein EV197_1838 [Aquimarina brevivitae]
MQIQKSPYIILLLTVLFSACSQYDPNTIPQHLEGYWEITKVQTQDGEHKSYTYNQTIDFITLQDSIGIRKKLQPQLNGTFITSTDQESFTVEQKNDSIYLHYTTPLDQWTETVLKADKEELIVKNQNGTTYIYKRYEKLNL